MTESVREIVHDLTNRELHIQETDSHYKVYTNTLREFEVEMLQDEFADADYESWRFDNNGTQFLKIPR